MTNNYFKYVFINMKSLLVIRRYILPNAVSGQGTNYRSKNPFTSIKMKMYYDKPNYLASSNQAHVLKKKTKKKDKIK